MRICKVWDSEYPWDVRVAKVAGSLSAAGHEVHLVSRNRTNLPIVEALAEATVHRLPPWPLGKLDASLQFPAFFNPRWIKAIFGTARSTASEMILVRDLPLAPTAILVGRLLKLPVMLDMAENYPAMAQSIFNTGVAKPVDRLVRNPAAVRTIEKWVLKRIDHVLVVVEESADRLAALDLDLEKITVVSNTPPLSRIAVEPPRTNNTGPLHMVYLGILEAPRGLSTVLEALRIVRTNGLDIRLRIIGDGRERTAFERLAESLSLRKPEVEFFGHLPNQIALDVVAKSDIGLVPHIADESWNTTVPNKLFDYMAAGIPVLCSSAKPAARVTSETEAGLVYEYDNPSAMAEAIQLIADPKQRALFAENGKAAIRTRYNWEQDSERLLSAITNMRR